MIQTLFGSVATEPSLLDRLKSGIEKTRQGLASHLETALAGRKEIDADLLDLLAFGRFDGECQRKRSERDSQIAELAGFMRARFAPGKPSWQGLEETARRVRETSP